MTIGQSIVNNAQRCKRVRGVVANKALSPTSLEKLDNVARVVFQHMLWKTVDTEHDSATAAAKRCL